jgi:hypothetical protein
MWMIDPQLLCQQHLLGEHSEIHKHKHNFLKGHSIKGRIKPIVQIEPLEMKSRHDALANEMIRRKYNHESPYTQPDLSLYSLNEISGKVDREFSKQDLIQRCPECAKKLLAI